MAVGDEVLVVSRGVVDTQRVAACLVPHLAAGDVVLLDGELGAGKTAFTQGLAAAAGVIDVVTSPTFTLVRPYRTTVGFDLVHVDVYRLEGPAEIAALGVAEMVEEDAVAVVEWGSRAAPALGAELLWVELAPTDDDVDGRTVVVRVVGPGWRRRWAALRNDLLALGGEAR